MKGFAQALGERLLILDGAIGTMIQSCGLSEADFRGDRFRDWPCDLAGNNDILVLTRPDVIEAIAYEYIAAGADIITTDTFNANAVSMADYGMEELAEEINREAARLLRALADRRSRETGRKIFVAGSVGPTNKTASMSPDVNNPALRAVNYDELFEAYATQVKGLIEGGVDLILFETVFDTLNLKAGIEAAASVMDSLGLKLPVMVSATLSGRDGRTFSGQTLDALLASIEHFPIASVGLNCSFGASEMKPHLAELSRKAPYPVSAHPNAGLPNAMGEYEESPESMARKVAEFVEDGLVNIVGGCCGTTPAHIAAIVDAVKGRKPRSMPGYTPGLHLSGLERLDITDGSLFVNVGERCNVAGSRKFLRLIREEKYDEALAIARKQVDDGAQIIDINMDDGMMDAAKEMCIFLNLIASEPDIARVPLMIDSSDRTVIEAALKCVQGKAIVNSISLKEGEAHFIDYARRLKRLGAAIVVMAFDEKGQADSYERKIEVCERAYRLLTQQAGVKPEDIIFDPNILAIATGIREHDRYGLDFIRATGWIKANLPGAKVSGGVSNLSFSFRGNNYLREAIHAVFLYHAIAAGMDMAIVNPSSSVTYDDIPADLRTTIEDAVLYRSEDASERLIAAAEMMLKEKEGRADLGPDAKEMPEDRTSRPLEERLTEALVKGNGEHLEADLSEALASGMEPVSIIDGPLMNGMDRVGHLFGEGKMFLPQVVKTARTMKQAVSILQPAIEQSRGSSGAAKAGKIVFATVKGDVHDIGKNIVSIVLACNNYEVIDLGVMVPPEEIVRVAKKERPDIVCLSGLITPSLEEMRRVVELMDRNGLDIPVMVGGATTSRIHTAVKIAPAYSGPVIHVTDASQNPLLAARLLGSGRDEFIAEIRSEYEALRERERMKKTPKTTLEEARKRSIRHTLAPFKAPAPRKPGRSVVEISIDELEAVINYRQLFSAWKLSPDLSDPSSESSRLYLDAVSMLKDWKAKEMKARAVVVLGKARSDGDDIVIGEGREDMETHAVRLPMLRRQSLVDGEPSVSLADYIAPEGDHIGLFAVTFDASEEISRYDHEGDSYRSLLAQTLAHRVVEAASEELHRRVRCDFWAYATDENLTPKELFQARYQGIRPAVGYPSLPDQGLTFCLDRLLAMKQIGIKLTESGAMEPSASVCGLYIAHPDAGYFLIGTIADDQLADYARRRNLTPDHARILLAHHL